MTTNTTNETLIIQPAIMEELTRVAAEEGTTVNQFVNALVAEKLAALRAFELIKERAARGDRAAISRILAKANGNEPPPATQRVACRTTRRVAGLPSGGRCQ